MEQCFECKHPVEYGDSISFRTGSTTKIMCADCTAKEQKHSQDWWPLHGPCVACGRIVYRSKGQATYIASAARQGWVVTGSGLTCTARCNRRAILDQAKAARHANRKPRTCPICAAEFIPKRDDAVTCSNKCRQALYRRNAKV